MALPDFRRRAFFLVTEPASTFLFVHAHAALLRLARIPAAHRDNAFVGRLVLGYLFHLAVVIERGIAARSGVAGLFKIQAEALSAKVGGRLHEKIGPKATRATDINDQQQIDADATLRRLLANTATYGGQPVQKVDRCLCVGYVLRNLGGHQSTAPLILTEEPAAIRTEMLGVLASCVEMYY